MIYTFTLFFYQFYAYTRLHKVLLGCSGNSEIGGVNYFIAEAE